MNKGNVAVGALAGLAIGGIVGILFAPEKGSTTRKQLVDKSNDFMDEIKSKFNELHDSLAEKIDITKEDVKEFADKGKAKIFEAKNEVKDAAGNFKHNYGAADHATSKFSQ